MGDVFHTFPALSDALKALPGLKIDWVVEKSFAEISQWHPAVDKVYPIELRKWKKSLVSKQTRQEVKAFFETVNQTQYDLIIDAQGLYKSLWVERRVNAPISGFDFKSAREPLSSLFYTQAWSKPEILLDNIGQDDYWVFLHGTTWETKYWPEACWIELLQKANASGVKVILPWGNQEEYERALRIMSSAENNQAWVPKVMLSLNDMAKTLKNAQAVVSVDTGLSHVAAALEVPMVVLYRVTDPKLVGADGSMVKRLQSPCAPLYLKKFKSTQQQKMSLEGLDVDAVFNAITTGF
jgi:heptosyltransferase-1